VGLPGCGFHDLGEGGALRAVQQIQDGGGLASGADALGLGLRGFRRSGRGLGRGRLLGLGCRSGLGLGTRALFWPLGAPFLGLAVNRMLEELGGIRETLVVYPRRPGQHQFPTAACLTHMNPTQQRLFSLLDLQRYAPAAS
jgi:hypothetical protein